MAKTLIAYYSRRGQNYVNGSIRNLVRGNTEVVAEKIKTLIPDADLFYIDTVRKYAEDYMASTQQAKEDIRNHARPELTATVENMSQYDTIILGYPIWWGLPPMAVYTFLESYDFSGKVIVPFSTHEGSGLGGSVRSIASTVPSAVVLAGTAIHGANAAHADREISQIVKQAQ